MRCLTAGLLVADLTVLADLAVLTACASAGTQSAREDRNVLTLEQI